MIAKITKVYTCHYRENGQITTYVEWIDEKGTPGRTEGKRSNPHIDALVERGKREGIELLGGLPASGKTALIAQMGKSLALRVHDQAIDRGGIFIEYLPHERN